MPDSKCPEEIRHPKVMDQCYICCGTGWVREGGWDRWHIRLKPTIADDPSGKKCKLCEGSGQVPVPFFGLRRDQTEPTPEMRAAFDAWRAARNELHPEARHAKMQKVLFAMVQRAAEGHESAIQALNSVGLASGVSAETVAAFQEAFKRCESKD